MRRCFLLPVICAVFATTIMAQNPNEQNQSMLSYNKGFLYLEEQNDNLCCKSNSETGYTGCSEKKQLLFNHHDKESTELPPYNQTKQRLVSCENQIVLKEGGNTFFGINAGLGLSYKFIHSPGFNEYNLGFTNGLAFSGGMDLAFPLGKKVNLGIFASLGYEMAQQDVIFGSGGQTAKNSFMISTGPLLLIKFNEGKAGALYLGPGYALVQNNSGIDLRLGYKFRKSLYLFGEVFVVDGWNGFGTGVGELVHLGFTF